MPYTDVTVNDLIVNVLTQDEYDSIQDPSNSELYLITDDAITPAQAVEDVSTVSAVGTSTQYARADHVHAITGTAITSALGYTPGQGTLTDSQVNGTSIVSNGVANFVTNTAYNASTNKLATMSDVDDAVSGVTAPVTSVNTKTGAVVLTASDVGALPDTTAIPTKVSDLQNDAGYMTSYTETDPTVPAWAKASTKPAYTAAEVGALPDTYVPPEEVIVVTFTKVDETSYTANKTFDEVLAAKYAVACALTDSGALWRWYARTLTTSSSMGFSRQQNGKCSSFTWIKSSGNITYSSQELELQSLKVTEITSSSTNNQYPSAKATYDFVTAALSDITSFSIEVVQSLPATGEQGVFYFVPNSGSGNNVYDEYIYVNNAFEKIGTTEIDLSNYLQKTDISDWAKAATKPTYTAAEVGALPDTYTAPVTSVNGQTGAVSLTIPSSVTNSYSADSNSGKVMLYTSTNSSSTVTQTKTSGALDFSISSGRDATLQIGKSSTDEGTRGLIKISNHANANYTTIDAPAWAATEIHLPSSSGTLALTSEIPSVSVTDVQINGTSIISNDVANIVTNTAYNASSNKIATMSDVPDASKILKYDLIVEFELNDDAGEITSSHTISQIEAVYNAGGSVCGHLIYTETSDGVTHTTDRGYFDYYDGNFKQFSYTGWDFYYIYYDENNSEWIEDYSSYYIDGNFSVSAYISNNNYILRSPSSILSPTFDDIAQYVSNSRYAIYLRVDDLDHKVGGYIPEFCLPMTYRFISSSHPANEMIVFSGAVFDGTDVVIRTIKLTRGSNGECIFTVINTPTVLPIYNGEVS